MKTFRTSGTGSGQTLSEIESDKMPIYNTMADAEADLANLEIGQIIAINTIGTERLAYVVSENGTKRIKDLTANVGTGAPVGSYIYMEKKSSPQGYLYCDGSTFDETVYPALYQYLGTNVLPDFREFSAVGAEQNTTNVYDASTNPNGVIHDHDVYAEGEAKDDQLQDHAHNNTWSRRSGTYFEGVASSDYEMQDNPLVSHEGVYGARTGTTTHGKRKAVFVYIKATSGLTENQQENVLNTINENLSYSTTEHATGKKWIDGKDIYSRAISEEITTYSDSVTGNRRVFIIVVTDANIDSIVGYYGNWVSLQGDMVGRQILLGMTLPSDNMTTFWSSNLIKTGNKIEINAIVDRSTYPVTKVKINAVIEYTKTV